MPPEQSYAVAQALHQTRVREGWRPIGRKIGFTNRSIWPRYGVYEPIWGTVYDRTLIFAARSQATVSLAGLLAGDRSALACGGGIHQQERGPWPDISSPYCWPRNTPPVLACCRPC